ncbi:MAG TPA: hypothetical protein VEK57_29375 [Thermoanaerobaculia bacterium]|nr:hypothetical protein [Thermoanaerobaculia bacterium]
MALYEGLVQKLADDDEKYARPLTVLNRQTAYRNASSNDFTAFLNSHVKAFSDVIDAWSVDTCQMWLAGFGRAFDKKSTVYDVYWLIPGDFDYDSSAGRDVLAVLERIPNEVYTGNAELCLGEIKVPLNSSKQLIDTYGTYGLLYNWFPAEAQGLRTITDKPRTEFFAISHDYLRKALVSQRWYGYEQTIVILLQGMQGVRPMREIRKFELGEIVDEPIGRDTLASAMQQVERTERVLKLYWRELKERQDPLWPDKFRLLDHQSEQIRSAAMVILQQILS